MAEEKKDIRVGRRSFLSRFGIGVAAVATTAVLPEAAKPETQSGSLRPKCTACSERIVIRNGSGYCPNTLCPAYWKPVGIFLVDETQEKKWLARKKEELKEKYLRLVRRDQKD